MLNLSRPPARTPVSDCEPAHPQGGLALFLALVLAVLVALAVAVVLLGLRMEKSRLDLIDSRSALYLNQLQSQLEGALRFGVPLADTRGFERLATALQARDPSLLRIVLQTEVGDSVAPHNAAQHPALTLQAALRAFEEAGRVSGAYREYWIAAAPIHDVIAARAGHVTLVYDLGPTYAELRQQWQRLLLSVAGLFAGVVLVLAVGVRHAVRALGNILRTLDQALADGAPWRHGAQGKDPRLQAWYAAIEDMPQRAPSAPSDATSAHRERPSV